MAGAENGSDSMRDRVTEDISRNALSLIPSDLGRLAYLAGLRDPNSGVYHHYGLETTYEPEACHRALRSVHLRMFYDWLKKLLVDQKEDVEHYLRSVEGDQNVVLENWRVLEPYRAFVPVDADLPARELFLEDMSVIVELLWRELFPPSRLQDA